MKTLLSVLLATSLFSFGCSGGGSGKTAATADRGRADNEQRTGEDKVLAAAPPAIGGELEDKNAAPEKSTATQVSEANQKPSPDGSRSVESNSSDSLKVEDSASRKSAAKAARPTNKKFDDRLENANRRAAEIINSHKGALKDEGRRIRENFDKILDDAAAINRRLP